MKAVGVGGVAFFPLYLKNKGNGKRKDVKRSSISTIPANPDPFFGLIF